MEYIEAFVKMLNRLRPADAPVRRTPAAGAACELIMRFLRRHPEARRDPTALAAAFFIACNYAAETRPLSAPRVDEFGPLALADAGDGAAFSAAISRLLSEFAPGGTLLYVLQKHLGCNVVMSWKEAAEARRAHAEHTPDMDLHDINHIADVCGGVTTLDDCEACAQARRERERARREQRDATLRPPTGAAWDVFVALHNEVRAQRGQPPAVAPAPARAAHELWRRHCAAVPGDEGSAPAVAAAYLLVNSDGDSAGTLLRPILQLVGDDLDTLSAAINAVMSSVGPAVVRWIRTLHASGEVMAFAEAVAEYYNERVAGGETGAVDMTPGSPAAARVRDIWFGVVVPDGLRA